MHLPCRHHAIAVTYHIRHCTYTVSMHVAVLTLFRYNAHATPTL